MTIQGVAQPAIRMGKHAAKMSAEDASADPRTAFRYYDKGDVVASGRYLAAADVRYPFQARLQQPPGMSRVASDSFAPSGWLHTCRDRRLLASSREAERGKRLSPLSPFSHFSAA